MRLLVRPGSQVSGTVTVPGDKSIAHRWLILASTASGPSRLRGLPPSLDVRSSAACLAAVAPAAAPGLEAWTSNAAASMEDGGSTWNGGDPGPLGSTLEVEGEGLAALVEPRRALDCGNSGTTLRLLLGVFAGVPLEVELGGDASLARRPMERVAEPLRSMGADVRTTDGHAPVRIRGGDLDGIEFRSTVASAQVKSAVLLAGLAAAGVTTVREPAPTRDHTERALRALGAPVEVGDRVASVRAFQHGGFSATVPGDPSTAAFLIAAAALTGGELIVGEVGLNPSRLHFLEVLGRMGVQVEQRVRGEELGEPVGDLVVEPCERLVPTRVEEDELPLVVDEVPMLAAVAAHAPGDSWFLGAGELRVKESDRLRTIAAGIRGLGGHAADEGADLVVAGGGLEGGTADSAGDHRIALGLAVAAMAARGPSEIGGFGSADVSFPGAADAFRQLGAAVEAR